MWGWSKRFGAILCLFVIREGIEELAAAFINPPGSQKRRSAGGQPGKGGSNFKRPNAAISNMVSAELNGCVANCCCARVCCKVRHDGEAISVMLGCWFHGTNDCADCAHAKIPTANCCGEVICSCWRYHLKTF
ncbi:MAG: hypothetical protein VR76_01545 [Pseudomonas sp. BRH_c35]|nr:MAG: hypothetical protein VR76_01545 [Pseudomonas sp. BRH_c35]